MSVYIVITVAEQLLVFLNNLKENWGDSTLPLFGGGSFT